MVINKLAINEKYKKLYTDVTLHLTNIDQIINHKLDLKILFSILYYKVYIQVPLIKKICLYLHIQ